MGARGLLAGLAGGLFRGLRDLEGGREGGGGMTRRAEWIWTGRRLGSRAGAGWRPGPHPAVGWAPRVRIRSDVLAAPWASSGCDGRLEAFIVTVCWAFNELNCVPIGCTF